MLHRLRSVFFANLDTKIRKAYTFNKLGAYLVPHFGGKIKREEI